MHRIRIKLYSLPLLKLNSFDKTSTSDLIIVCTNFTAMVLVIGHHKLFKTVTIHGNEKENLLFLPLFLANKCLDTINRGNILHTTNLSRAKVPSYFKDQSVPINSHSYTSHIAANTFNG